MSKIMLVLSALALGLHGLIHLIGTAVYMKLTEVQGFPYKTTLLGGRWDLGDRGIRAFGALWIVPAVGFIVAGVALVAGWEWWRSILVSVTLLSLLLTVLDTSIAYAGIIINIVILALVFMGPGLASMLSQ